MDVTDTLYVPTRRAWREWLAAHGQEASEIWLVSYRKATGQLSVPYNDAVEEALCVGWIDSVRKGLDAERYAQRFTPRRQGSAYSQTNKERLARLGDLDLLTPDIAATLEQHRPDAFEVPDDIRAALQAAPGAWAFFQGTSPSYQRIRAAYVEHARTRPDAFATRLRNLVEKSARETQFGYGIESYY